MVEKNGSQIVASEIQAIRGLGIESGSGKEGKA